MKSENNMGVNDSELKTINITLILNQIKETITEEKKYIIVRQSKDQGKKTEREKTIRKEKGEKVNKVNK